MTQPPVSSPSGQEPGGAPEDLGHPRGTLAIVIVFGLLFGLGWLAMYCLRFLALGAPHP
jgi:hypothetical protein